MNAANQWKMTLFLAASLLGCSIVLGQTPGSAPPPSSPQSQQPAAPGQGQGQGQQAAPLEGAPPPVSAEEEAAFKAFNDPSNNDLAKKDQQAVDFLQKYPQSRYRAEIYSWQVKYYFSVGQIDKMEEAGDKELALAPNDAQTLAIMGSALPRKMSASTPDPDKRLAKAEQYSQKALELLPTFPKPDNMTEEMFTKAKNQTSAMAYSGLGLVAFRRGKYADAIPNLEKSVQLDPDPDPVNYYLLGICNEKTSHFDDAVADFTKCSNLPGGLQATCKTNIDEAKKLGATQLSAPK
ncbi:MAG: tetratricopeptide repeat protein [Candidatus Acidiferrum sp.]